MYGWTELGKVSGRDAMRHGDRARSYCRALWVMEFFGFYSRYDQKDLNRKRHDQSLCFNRPLQFTGSQPGAFLPLRRHLAVPEDVLLS